MGPHTNKHACVHTSTYVETPQVVCNYSHLENNRGEQVLLTHACVHLTHTHTHTHTHCKMHADTSLIANNGRMFIINLPPPSPTPYTHTHTPKDACKHIPFKNALLVIAHMNQSERCEMLTNKYKIFGEKSKVKLSTLPTGLSSCTLSSLPSLLPPKRNLVPLRKSCFTSASILLS